MMYLFTLGLVVMLMLPLYAIYKKKVTGKRAKFTLGVNIASFAAFCGIIIVASTHGAMAAADAQMSPAIGMGFISAALATGLSCIGAGIAVASSASSALGAISENSSILGKSLIFVALAEGVALYGLLISIQILNKLPSLM